MIHESRSVNWINIIIIDKCCRSEAVSSSCRMVESFALSLIFCSAPLRISLPIFRFPYQVSNFVIRIRNSKELYNLYVSCNLLSCWFNSASRTTCPLIIANFWHIAAAFVAFYHPLRLKSRAANIYLLPVTEANTHSELAHKSPKLRAIFPDDKHSEAYFQIISPFFYLLLLFAVTLCTPHNGNKGFKWAKCFDASTPAVLGRVVLHHFSGLWIIIYCGF